MKLYAYKANEVGHEDGVFGGFGIRDQKGTLTNNIAFPSYFSKFTFSPFISSNSKSKKLLFSIVYPFLLKLNKLKIIIIIIKKKLFFFFIF